MVRYWDVVQPRVESRLLRALLADDVKNARAAVHEALARREANARKLERAV